MELIGCCAPREQIASLRERVGEVGGNPFDDGTATVMTRKTAMTSATRRVDVDSVAKFELQARLGSWGGGVEGGGGVMCELDCRLGVLADAVARLTVCLGPFPQYQFTSQMVRSDGGGVYDSA